MTSSADATAPIPMLERRRIEAAILKHVYDSLKQSHGEQIARPRGLIRQTWVIRHTATSTELSWLAGVAGVAGLGGPARTRPRPPC